MVLVVKNPPANAGDSGDTDSIPGSGISLGVGNGNPLWESRLENSMDRGAWRSTVHGVAKSRTQLSDHHFPFFFPQQCLALDMFYQAILHALSAIFHNPDFFKHEN